MEKTRKNLLIKVSVLVVLIVIGFITYKNLNKNTPENWEEVKLAEIAEEVPFIDETKNPTSSEVLDKKPNNISLIQSVPYVDLLSKFSINLPIGWSVISKDNTETSSKVTFSDSSISGAPGIKIAVERLERNGAMEKNIREMGEDGVLLLLADDLGVSLGLTNVSIKKIAINSTDYFHLSGVYVGQVSKKEVTQNVYFALTPDAHYRIGVDAYTDVWMKNKDAIFQSINSIFLN